MHPSQPSENFASQRCLEAPRRTTSFWHYTPNQRLRVPDREQRYDAGSRRANYADLGSIPGHFTCAGHHSAPSRPYLKDVKSLSQANDRQREWSISTRARRGRNAPFLKYRAVLKVFGVQPRHGRKAKPFASKPLAACGFLACRLMLKILSRLDSMTRSCSGATA